MKRKLIITLSVLAGFAVLGLGIYHSGATPANPELSRDEIRNKVHAQYPGEITAVDLKKSVNAAVYEVVLETDDKSYLIQIDGITGEVIDMEEQKKVSEKPADVPDKKEPKKDKEKDSTDKNESDETKQKDPSENEKKENHESKKAVIGSKKAKEIALKEFPGTVAEVELDEDDNRLIYEIQVENGEDEAEIEIDAYTGEIIIVNLDLDE